MSAPTLVQSGWHAPRRLERPRIGAGTVVARYVAVGAAALAVAGAGALHLRHRPATLCPFRALTGLPCPFCGGTTAASDLGHGHLGTALRASPLAVGLFATWPLLGALRRPRWLAWWDRPQARWLAIALVLIASEVWQLVRFGVIGPAL